ncbi:hypothetical protein Tco_0008140 [Tanacetum coccineum]
MKQALRETVTHRFTLTVLSALRRSEPVEAEIQSLVDVPILQQKPADQRPPLVDTTVLARLEKKVDAMSKFKIPKAIDKFIQAHLKKNVLPKDVPNIGKLKKGKAAKQSMPKYSTTLFDQAALSEYDQKDKLLKLMMKSKSYDKHPAHRLEDQSTLKKRHRDDNDKDPSVGSEKEKKKRKQKDYESSKKDKDQAGSSKNESVEEDVADAKDPSQADASVPKRDRSTWFKIVAVERHESPDPEWHKEPTVDDAPE